MNFLFSMRDFVWREFDVKITDFFPWDNERVVVNFPDHND